MLPSKILLIQFEGAPVFFAHTDEEAREFLADVLEEGAEGYDVWAVYSDTTPADRITLAFADAWSLLFEFGSGDDPDEFLKPFPGFVRAVAGEALIQCYRAAQEIAQHEAVELSNLRTL